MIINNKDAIARLNSPMNLINKLKESKKNNAMNLFGIHSPQASPERKKIERVEKIEKLQKVEKIESLPQAEEVKTTFNPFSPVPVVKPEEKEEEEKENIDTILNNNDAQIKLGLAHDKALDLLTASVSALSAKLDDVRADKLPSVIAAASRTVESIRKERTERDKNNKERDVHFHFYTPEQNKLSDYPVIDVTS